MTAEPQPSTFVSQLSELHAAAMQAPWSLGLKRTPPFERSRQGIAWQDALWLSKDMSPENAELVVFLRNHAEAILALVKAVEEAERKSAVGPFEPPQKGRVPDPWYNTLVGVNVKLRKALEALDGR